MEKPENVLRATNRHTAFKITITFLYQVLAYRKGNLVFNIVYGNLWFDGDFFVRNLDTSVGLRQYKSLFTKVFLFFLPWTFFRF